MKIEKLNEFKTLAIEYRRSIMAILIFLSISIFLGFFKSEKQVQKNLESIDTIIPKGHSLIPIEIQNKEALETMMGPYAIIDLFTFNSSENTKGKRIANAVKLLRAPLDHQQFGILITDEEAQNVLLSNGPYFVVLKSPNEKKKTNNKIAKIKTTIEID